MTPRCSEALHERIIRDVRQSGRTILTEYESKQLLTAYGIPTVETRVAITEDEALQAADEIGYPIVLKLYSLTITHKTDVGGVQLNLRDAEAVRKAFQTIKQSVTEKAGAEHFQGVTVQPMAKLDGYELIIGSSLDSQFGPVMLFGTGGQLVEVFKDRALALPPLNSTLALAHDGADQDLQGAARAFAAASRSTWPRWKSLLVRFSQLVVEQPWIKEIDINPLLASPDRPAGARCPRGGARARGHGRRAAHRCHPALSHPPGQGMDDEGRQPGDHPARSVRKTSRSW